MGRREGPITLSEETARGPEREVQFESSTFIKSVVRVSPRFEILSYVLPQDGLEIRFHRWSPSESKASASFRMASASCGFVSDQRMGTVVTGGDQPEKPILWLPRGLVVGRQDPHGRFVEVGEASVESRWELDGEHTLHLQLTAGEKVTVFWPMVVFFEKTLLVAKEAFHLGEIESRTYLKSDWFRASSPADLWRYFIDGSIFDPRDDGKGRFRCQQCALAWWSYLDAMHNRAGNGLYRALARAVAWSVLIDLGSDGLWRHGYWHEEPEVHSRMLWDGVHLLLSEFESAPDPRLLAASEGVVASAIENLTEELADTGLWFLHDSVENTRPLRVPDPILQRSPTNSLCLNTHVQALCVLARMRALEPTEDHRFDDEYQRGMKALEEVLGLDFGSGPLRWVDRFLPRLLACKVPHGLAERIVRFVIFRVGIRAYWWARRRSRALVFPSGYLDRDLGLTMLADEYHVVNLKDLVELEGFDPRPWLGVTINRAVRFAAFIDFRRAMERSPIWAEWADVVEVLGSEVDVDREVIAAQVRTALGGEPLDSFCVASRRKVTAGKR